MHLGIIRYSFSFLISFLITLYLIPFFASIARKLKVLDVPDGRVKNHARPIPYLGGAAVYLGFIATLALVFPYQNRIALLLVGSTLLLFVGLIDDILRIKPYQKFFWQLIAAFCFLKSGLYLKESFFLGNIWSIPLSLLWILTIINAFNLVDVMDGLATTLAICTSMSLFFIALIFGQLELALLLICFLGPLFAFLYYNRPPAKIYLGDAGSLFIGGFLATIPFLFSWSSYNLYGFVVPVLILAIPLLEVGTLILVRFYKKIPFYYGSPDHFSIYLQQGGWSKNKILNFVIFVSSLLLILSLLFVLNKISLSILSLSFLSLVLFWFITIWINSKTKAFGC